MWTALLAFAEAGPLRISAAGLPAAQAVAAVVRTSAGVAGGSCNDAGTTPDPAVDGIWTCEVPTDADQGEVFLVVDGALVSAGTLPWGQARVAAVRVNKGVVSLSPSLADLPTVVALPAPARTVLLARVEHHGTGAAPVLSVGDRQLACRDDGQFPDEVMNDGVPGCGGAVDSGAKLVALQTADGRRVAVGQFVVGADPLQLLLVDAKAGTSAVGGFELPLPLPERVPEPTPPPAEESPPRETPEVAPSQRPQVAPKEPVNAPERAATSGVALRGLLPWAGLVTLGLGGVVLSRRLRGRRTPNTPGLRAHPAPPLFAGGPTLQDHAALLRTGDPPTLARFLVPLLADRHRVILVSAAEVPLPPTFGVWCAGRRSWSDLARQARTLAGQVGPPVALVIVGSDTVTDPGAVKAEGVRRLVDALPSGVWVGVLVREDEPGAVWVPEWRVSGPPWEGRRA